MSHARFLPALVVLGACAEGATVEGTLLDADDARYVWVEDLTDPAPIDSTGFRLEGLTGDTLDLLFGDEGEPAGRMRLLGLSGGTRLVLNDVWFEDDLAFPTSVNVEGGGVVDVNGLRMAAPAAAGEEVSARGTLLAISGDGDHAIVRPTDGGLPDLQVVLEAATVRSVDGEPVRASQLSAGDTVEVRGAVAGDYVLATEVTVPRSLAAGLAAEEREAYEERVREAAARDDDDDDDRGGDAGGRGGPPIRDGWPGRGRGRGRD